jgi:hypothetical protein
MRLQRERVPAGAAALLGVAMALPSVVAPTWRLTTLDSQSGVVLFDQQDWSWGRTRLLGAGGAVTQDLWNPLGLVVLVLLLALAAVGAGAWLLSKTTCTGWLHPAPRPPWGCWSPRRPWCSSSPWGSWRFP